MSDYATTKARILQYVGIILVMGVFAGAYWYFQVFAGYKTSTGQTGILTSGLVGIWSFDGADVSGSTATDRSGSSNTGTISGATVTPGKVGQALSFDGVDDSVNAGNDASIQLTTGTISAWIKTTGAGSGYRAIIVKGNAYGLFLNDNVLTVYDWGASAARSTGMNLSDGNWHLVTQVFQSGVASGTTVYVDGVLVLTTTMTVSSQGVQLGIGDSVGSSQFFAGTIDEPRVYSRTLSASEIQSLYKLGQSDEVNSGASQAQGGSRLDSGLAGYWPLDNGSGTSATDASTNGNTGTLTNGPTWGTGQIGGAVDFDGTDDYIDMGDLFYSDVFTVCAWARADVIDANTRNIVVKRNTPGVSPGSNEWTLNASSSGFTFTTWTAASTTALNVTGSTVPSTATWYHVCGVEHGNGKTGYVYVNGAQNGSATQTAPLWDTTDRVQIGARSASSDNRYFNGLIDEVRVYNRALLDEEISQLYRLSTPTGVDTGLKGYWSFNGKDISGTSAYDRSGVGTIGTLTNSPVVTPGTIGQALNFDGVDDYVQLASNTTLDIDDNFTISAWVRPESFATLAGIVGKYHAVSGDYFLRFNSASPYNKIEFGGSTSITSNTTLTTGQWYHIVAERSSGTGYIYINGVLDTSGSVSIGSSASNDVTIGLDYLPSPRYFKGKIDEVRIYNRVLSGGEIKSLYDSGQSDEVNTGASQAGGGSRLDSGLAGYWKLDDGSGTSATDASTNGNTGTLTNGPTWGTGQIGGDVVFDGIDDYINIPSPPSSIKPQARMSISAWVKRSASGEVDYIFWERDSVAQEEGIFFYFDTDNKMHFVFRISGTGYVDVASTTTVTDTNWHMLTATLGASNLLTFYVDGTYAGSGTTTTPNTGVTIGNALIGARNDGTTPDAYGSFSIDEFRFYSRTLSADEVTQLYRLSTSTGTDTSLKGYWPFNGKDVSDTTTYDRSGVGNAGTLTNGPSVTPGKVGQALSLDGANDYVSIANSTALQFSGAVPITLSLWVNPAQNTAIGTFLVKGRVSDGNAANYAIRQHTSGKKIEFYYNDSGSASWQTWTSTSDVFTSANTWYHVGITFTFGTGGSLIVYVNGSTVSGSWIQGTGNVSADVDTQALVLGQANGGERYAGKLDEVRIYNRILTAGEIAGLYNGGR